MNTSLEYQLEKALLSFCKPEQVMAMMEDVGRGIKPTHYLRIENQLPDEELAGGQDTIGSLYYEPGWA